MKRLTEEEMEEKKSTIEIGDHVKRRLELELMMFNEESPIQLTMTEFLEDLTEWYRLRKS